MTGTKRKPGRPRRLESVEVHRSPEEAELTDSVLRYAQEHEVSFETAFGKVGVTHPHLAALSEQFPRASVTEQDAPRAVATPVLGAAPSVRMLTPRQAAQEWDVNPTTLVKWLTAGRIHGRKTPEGDWKIPADQRVAISDLQRYDWKRRGREVPDEPDAREVALSEMEIDDSETARAARKWRERILAGLEAQR